MSLILFGLEPPWVATPSEVPIRDFDALSQIRDLLDATEAFGRVVLGDASEFEVSGGIERIAYVQPTTWDETDPVGSPIENYRNVQYVLTIIVKDEDATRRYNRLDQLQQLAQNTLNGVSYLGETDYPYSRLKKGRYHTGGHPFGAISMQGEFSYVLEGYDGHQETDNVDDIFN